MYIVQSYAKEPGNFAVTKNCYCLMDSIVGSHHQLCHVYVATNNNTYITSLEPRYTQIRAQTISSTLHQSWVIVRRYSKNASILENNIFLTSFFTVLTSQQATRKITALKMKNNKHFCKLDNFTILPKTLHCTLRKRHG